MNYAIVASTKLEDIVKNVNYLKLHTFDGLAYRFIYNTLELTVSVYKDSSLDSFIIKVNKEGLYFVNPRMGEKLEYIFNQYQGSDA